MMFGFGLLAAGRDLPGARRRDDRCAASANMPWSGRAARCCSPRSTPRPSTRRRTRSTPSSIAAATLIAAWANAGIVAIGTGAAALTGRSGARGRRGRPSAMRSAVVTTGKRSAVRADRPLHQERGQLRPAHIFVTRSRAGSAADARLPTRSFIDRRDDPPAAFASFAETKGRMKKTFFDQRGRRGVAGKSARAASHSARVRSRRLGPGHVRHQRRQRTPSASTRPRRPRLQPVQAGNVRVNGMYFDCQADLNQRLIFTGSNVRVGLTAQGYPFPAPTASADFSLRLPGSKPSRAR